FVRREPPAPAGAHDPVELVRGMTAVGRRLDRNVFRGENVPFVELTCGDELLPHLADRRLLDRERSLYAVAESAGHALQVAHELPHSLRHQRERVIRAL